MGKKTNLYVVTLEPIEQRYTKQWYSFWKKEFSKSYNVKYIDGETLSEGIEKGRFLDINQTNMWKAIQVEKMSRMFFNNEIKKNDTFIFMDGWHFGITALRYMSQLNSVPIKIYAYWHAGTWDEWDFITQAGLGEWASYNEEGWFRALNGSFVSTNFHKEIILKKFKDIDAEKIYVVGFPMDWDAEINSLVEEKPLRKENLIVFPHRLDIEKAPEVFDILKQRIRKFKFVKTMEVTKGKKDYYELIANAKVAFSASHQETFGIGTVEAMMLGAIPLVPNRLSYIELYHPMFRYKSKGEARKKLENFVLKYYSSHVIQLNLKNNQEKIKKQSLEAIPKMIRIMKNGSR